VSALAWWWWTLGVALVVTGVVAALLAAIAVRARRIEAVLRRIWVEGPILASNTAALDQLRRINEEAGHTLEAAGRIAAAATRILEHAHGCPGCPQCVTGWSTSSSSAGGDR